jgi:hypothetical protein
VPRIRVLTIVMGGKGRLHCICVVLLTLARSTGQVNIRTHVLGSKWLAESGTF